MSADLSLTPPADDLHRRSHPRTGPFRTASLTAFSLLVIALGLTLAHPASRATTSPGWLGRLFSPLRHQREQQVIVSGHFPELLENAEVKFHGLVIGHVKSYTYNDEATRFLYTLVLNDCQINRAWVFTQATVEQSPPVVGARWLEMADNGKQRLRPVSASPNVEPSSTAVNPSAPPPDITIQASQDWLAVLQSPQGLRDFLWSSLPESDRANLAEATGRLRAAADDLSEMTRDFKINGLASERLRPTLQPLLTQANADLADLDSPHFQDTYDHLLANVRLTSDNYAKVLDGYGELASDLNGTNRTKKTDLGRLVANAADSSAQLTATMQKLTPQMEALSNHLNSLITSYQQVADSVNHRGVWSWVFPSKTTPSAVANPSPGAASPPVCDADDPSQTPHGTLGGTRALIPKTMMRAGLPSASASTFITILAVPPALGCRPLVRKHRATQAPYESKRVGLRQDGSLSPVPMASANRLQTNADNGRRKPRLILALHSAANNNQVTTISGSGDGRRGRFAGAAEFILAD